MATGIKAHKEHLEILKTEMKKLGEKFENGTIQDFEKDRMGVLGQEIRNREPELRRLNTDTETNRADHRTNRVQGGMKWTRLKNYLISTG